MKQLAERLNLRKISQQGHVRTGVVLAIEVDHHMKESPLDIVRLFTLKYELLCDSIHKLVQVL